MTVVAALRASVLFGTLPQPVLAQLAEWFVLRPTTAGEVLLREDEESARLYVVASGRVVVCKGVVGVTEALVARVGPGDHLGEIDLVDGQTATATVIAEEDGVVIELAADRFRRMLVSDRPLFAHVARVLLTDMAVKVRRTNERVRETIAWGLDACGDGGA